MPQTNCNASPRSNWRHSWHLGRPASAASLLFVITACACAALVPALRAGRIDPIAALRQD
jgi:hypothetical protein